MAAYIALIHKQEDSDYGISFPDFPGCITAGRTLEEAFEMAEEALSLHVEVMLENGEELPQPSRSEDVTRLKDSRGAMMAVVPLHLPKKKAVRVDITVNQRLLRRIDRVATEGGETRSGFFEAAAKHELERRR